jgi:tetraacyldisaccharide 4'-kinase
VSAAPDWGAFAQRLWRSESAWSRLLRCALLVPAGAYQGAVALKNGAYDLGLLRARPLALPSVGVGNIAVGGVGKTPLAAHLARALARSGLRPGILLRGYGGGDETAELAERVSEAVVEADPDRRRGAARAAARGAEVLVLDDCLQRRDMRVDALLAVVASETAGERRWRLPAGPWREGLGALGRCEGVVVTSKAAGAEEAADLARRLGPRTRMGIGVAVALEVARFVPLHGGAPLPVGWLAGRHVIAICGIGAPDLFRTQLERLGARVRLIDFGDHHAYSPGDLAAASAMAGPDGVVVTTAKDAVKLRRLWNAAAPPCVVAVLEIRVTYGERDLARILERVGAAARRRANPAAAGVPPSVKRTSR